MGKIKANKRLSAGRQASDPMGTKLALADEIESLKLAKAKITDPNNLNAVKKRHADEDEVSGLILNFYNKFGLLYFMNSSSNYF